MSLARTTQHRYTHRVMKKDSACASWIKLVYRAPGLSEERRQAPTATLARHHNMFAVMDLNLTKTDPRM